MAFSYTLVPAPSKKKGIPYTWFTTLLANTVDLHDRTFSTYTPTWTNGTLGNGTRLGEYWRMGAIPGGVVLAKVDLIWGSTTSSSGAWSFSFPVTAATGTSFRVASGEAIDASSGQSWDVRGRLTSSTAFQLFTGDGASSATVSTTSPFTWTTSDELHLTIMFKAA